VVWGKDVLVPRPSKYPEEFRRDAVELVRSSPQRTLQEVGRELGVNHETLRNWVNAAKRAEQATAGQPAADEISAGESLSQAMRWASSGGMSPIHCTHGGSGTGGIPASVNGSARPVPPGRAWAQTGA
jgi:transposase-like protein